MSKYISPKLVVAEAWEITKEYRKQLFWYGFIPAFFGMVVGTVYVLYQIVAFRHFLLRERDTVAYGEIFQQAWNFLAAKGTPTGLLITFVVIILLGYFTLPIFCKCSLVFLIEKIKKGEDLEKGIQVGFMRFMPMFEFGAIKNAASPASFFTEASFIMRNLGTGFFRLILPIIIIFICFGLIALFFFAYVEQVIVLQKKGLMSSVARSLRLTFNYFSETFRLFLLILLIELRVIVNVAVILLLPIAIFAIMGVFTSSLLHGVGIVLSVIVGLTLLSAAATVSGILEIFSTAMWTIAFHNLTPDEEKVTQLDMEE